MSKEYQVGIKIVGNLDKSFNEAIQLAKNGLGVLGSLGKSGAAALQLAGKGMAATAGAVAALGAASVKTGSEFESSMSQVAATMLIDKQTAEGAAAFQTLEEAARECGRTTAFSASEAAEGLNYLALAGYDAEQAATALPTVLRLAGAGAMDLADASDMVTDSMAALGITATQSNLEAFADKMALTASKANTSVAQLGEAILTVGGTASGLAGGTTELNASLGILADSGIKAAEGGTHLRNMILSLQNPRNAQAAQLMKQLGISAYDSQGNMRSLGDTFGDLNKQLSSMNAEEANQAIATIFNQTDLASARAMLAATGDSVQSLATIMDSALMESGQSLSGLGIDLSQMAGSFDAAATQEQFAAQMLSQYGMSAENAGVLFSGLQSIVSGTGNRFDELTAAIEGSEGAAQKMYDLQLDNLQGDIDELSSAFEDLGISIYKDVGGPVRGVTQLATNMINNINAAYADGGMSAAFVQVGSELAAGVSGMASAAPQFAATATQMMQALISGIQANLPVIASGLASAGVQVLQGIASLLPQFLQTGLTAMAEFGNGIAQNMPQVLSAAVNGIAGIGQAFMTGIPQLLQSGTQIIRSLAEGIGQALPELIPTAMNALLTFSQNLRTNFGELFSAGMDLILTLGEGLIDGLPTFIATIPQIVTNIAGLINDNAPKLIATGIQLIGKLALGIIQAIPTLISNIPQIIQSIIAVFTAFNWVNLGVKVITSIGSGIASMISRIPQMFSNLVNTAKNIVTSTNWFNLGIHIMETLGNGLLNAITSIPQIFMNLGQTAISALTSIDWWGVGTTVIQMIGEAISGAGGFLLDAIGDIGSSIVNGIKGLFSGDSGQTEAASGGQAAAAGYAEGISQGSAQAGAAAASLNAQAFSTMDTSAAKLAGTISSTAFTVGISEGMASQPVDLSAASLDAGTMSVQMAETGATAGSSLSEAFGQQMPDMSLQVQNGMTQVQGTVDTGVTSLVSTVQSGGDQAVLSAQATANGIQSALNIDLSSTGRDMMQGLIDGINSMRSQVEAAARQVAEAAAASVNAALQINSPSRLMMQAGEFTGEGLALGMLNQTADVAQAAQTMTQPVQASAETPAFETPSIENIGTVIRDALGALTGMAGGADSAGSSAPAQAPVFNFNPTYVFEGVAPEKGQIVEENRMSQSEFEQMANEWVRNNGRLAFG